MRIRVFGAIVALVFGTQAGAATVTVTETSDFANNRSQTTTSGQLINNVGTTPAGTTLLEVVGTMRCDTSPCPTGFDSGDAFYFGVGANQKVTAINWQSEGVFGSQIQLQLRDSSGTNNRFNDPLVFQERVPVNSNQQVFGGSVINPSLGPGTYNFFAELFISGGAGSSNFTPPGEVAWTFAATIEDVTPIPLPAGALLLLTGLGGLTLLRRRT